MEGLFPSRYGPSEASDAITGELRCFSLDFAPADWLPCDGQLVRVQDHPALFAAIGTTYGGDGAGAFAVPDLRGRLLFHEHLDRQRRVGTRVGAGTVDVNSNYMPAHGHRITTAPEGSPPGDTPALVTRMAREPAFDHLMEPAGRAAEPLDIMPPVLAMRWYIHAGDPAPG